ncbi:hypothetical protein BGZ74_000107, partial [Mortierella antarctica]
MTTAIHVVGVPELERDGSEPEELFPVLEFRQQTDISFQEQDEEQEEELDVDIELALAAPVGRKGKATKKKAVISLPAPPEFEPLIRPMHHARHLLPSIFDNRNIPAPITLFRLFFTDDILNTIVTNTNEYADTKSAGAVGRAWRRMEVDELMTWIAITIYIGLHKLSSNIAIWNKNGEEPTHSIS